MTADQKTQLQDVRYAINEIRCILDGIMYDRVEPVLESEFKKLRECYNFICQANDVL